MLNARTSVLAAANPVFGKYDDMRQPFENIEFQSTILSRFDLIFLIKDVRNENKDRLVQTNNKQTKQNSNNFVLYFYYFFFCTHKQISLTTTRTIAQHVINIHMRGQTTESETGEIDIYTLKRYVSYCRAKFSPRLSQVFFFHPFFFSFPPSNPPPRQQQKPYKTITSLSEHL